MNKVRVFYVCNVYNSECMLLYDSVVFTLVPSALSIEITVFSLNMRLAGSIPSEIENLASLTYLSMRGNDLSGT